MKGFHDRNNEGHCLIKVVCQSCVCAGSSSTLAYCHTHKLDTRKLIAIEYHSDVYFSCNCMENVRGRFSQSEIQRMNEARSSHSALYLGKSQLEWNVNTVSCGETILTLLLRYLAQYVIEAAVSAT